MFSVTFHVPHTLDTLFDGAVRLVQPAKGYGYRVNADAILLAAFARSGRSASAKLAVDLGAGVGAAGLCLAFLGGARQLVMLERDPRLVEIARHNLELNGLTGKGVALVCDLCEPLRVSAPHLVHRADLVVANPPYTKPSRGNRSQGPPGDTSRLTARHGELSPFLNAMGEALGHRGKAYLVYPALELVDMLTSARACGLEAKRLRFVHGKSDRPARIALVELARARPGGLLVEPPLFERDASSQPTSELERLLRPSRRE